MTTKIAIAVYANGDDAFVAWAPTEFIPQCRGFQLERARKTATGQKVEVVENRVGFSKDKPKAGEHRPSSEWPFQRFNWTDHAVGTKGNLRYRVTAMIDAGSGRPYENGASSRWSAWKEVSPDVGGGFACFFNRGLVLSQFVARYLKAKNLPCTFEGS